MSLILAIDFDGTITKESHCAEFPEIRENCADVLKEFKRNGFKLILWTCRTDKALDSAKSFLQNWGIFELFDTINEQLPEVLEKYGDNVARKIWADYYIDDKNLNFTVDWLEIRDLIFEKLAASMTISVLQKRYNNTDFEGQVHKKLKQLFPDMDEFELKSLCDYYLSLPFVNQTKPLREDNLLFCCLFPSLAEVQYKKEGTYGRSWCKRGEMDVFFNTARKFDRLENMMLNGAKDEVGEGKIDTVADLTNYGLLWMTYFMRNNPEEFYKWKKTN